MNQNLPPLLLNSFLLQDFLDAETPTITIGLARENNQDIGFIAIRPDREIPDDVTIKGFKFGHNIYGNSDIILVHFVFYFYNFGSYNALLNANNHIVRTVLNKMIDNQDYFFFSVNPDNKAMSFRSNIGKENFVNLQKNMPQIMNATTTDDEYYKALQAFKKNPDPEGDLLYWSCRNNVDYLDLSKDTIQINPTI